MVNLPKLNVNHILHSVLVDSRSTYIGKIPKTIFCKGIMGLPFGGRVGHFVDVFGFHFGLVVLLLPVGAVDHEDQVPGITVGLKDVDQNALVAQAPKRIKNQD